MAVIIILLILWYLAEKIDIYRSRQRVKRINQYKAEQRQLAQRQREQQRQLVVEARQEAAERKEAIREHQDNIKEIDRRFRSVQRVEKAERTIDICGSILASMEEEAESLQNRIDYCKQNNLPYSGLSQELFKLQKKMLTYSDRVYNAAQIIEYENFKSA